MPENRLECPKKARFPSAKQFDYILRLYGSLFTKSPSPALYFHFEGGFSNTG